MALELYCDGAVLIDAPQPTQGACECCGAVTDRAVKSAHDRAFYFECDRCDPVADAPKI